GGWAERDQLLAGGPRRMRAGPVAVGLSAFRRLASRREITKVDEDEPRQRLLQSLRRAGERPVSGQRFFIPQLRSRIGLAEVLKDLRRRPLPFRMPRKLLLGHALCRGSDHTFDLCEPLVHRALQAYSACITVECRRKVSEWRKCG